MATIKSTVTTENRINANVSPPSKIVPKNVVLHDVTAASVGLENVDNTSDINKPVSTATQTALDLKANQSTTYTKTEVDAEVTAASTSASLALTAHGDLTNNPHSVTATQIGLGNVENKSAATIIGEIVDSDIPSTITRDSELSAHTSLTNNPHSVTKTQVSLGNVTNESKTTMFTDPTFTGNPQSNAAPTSNDHLTNKTYVDTQVAGVVDSAPEALDTLNELAAALGDDANFATTTATSIGEKLAKASNLSDLADDATARTNLGLGSVDNKSSATIRGEIVDGDIPSTIARDSELTAHTSLTDNPHSVTKTQVGLGNVEDKSSATIRTEIVDSNIPSTITRDSELNAHTSLTNNPHSVTKAQVGLGNVENKSSATIRSEIVDGDIPSTITRDSELSAHTSLTNNPHSVTKAHVGLPNVEDKSAATIIGEIVDGDIPSTIARDSELSAHTSLTNNPHSVTKAQVGLTNVDNTSDINKPISTATQTALAGKQDTLTFGRLNTNAVKIDNTSAAANPGDICKFAGNGIMPYTFLDIKYDLGLPVIEATLLDKANKASPEFTGNVGIGLSGASSEALDMNGHFRLKISSANRTAGKSVALIKSDDKTAANLRVEGPVAVTHDLFKNSGVDNGFADNSNHFHTIQKINRITQQSGSGTANERVQEQYYAIENNNLKNSKAAFWNWHRVSKEVSSTAVALTNLVGWNVSGIQDSSNRTATSQVSFPTGGAEATTFTFDTAGNNPFTLNDVLQIAISIDFEGAIVAATLFAKVTAVSGATATVVLYGGNYKSTDEVADGNSQTALTNNFTVEKIDTTQYIALSSGFGIDVLSDSTRTTTTDTFSLTFASAHSLQLNDTVTIITDSSGGFQAAEVAFVKEVTSTTAAKFVYGRVFEPESRLALGDLGSGQVVGVLKGTLDGLHRFTAGDQLMHFNADNEGRYKSYQIGPGSEVGADCIAIGKNVYNKDASTIKIGYDNNMLNIDSAGIDVAGTVNTTGNITAPRLITNEIQCVGTTTGTAQPITYDAKEHRFRDYDETPSNLMVIKKVDGVPIGKVGINHNNPVSALHVVGGHTAGGGIPNEALRVVGSGLFTSTDEIALVVARDTNNTVSTNGGHVLKLKQDVSTASTSNKEELNIGFVGSGGGGIYTNSTSLAAYIDVQNSKSFEIAVGGKKALSLHPTVGYATFSNGALFNGDIAITDKIIHSGDSGTALRFPSNDIFTIETGGAERVRVGASGLVTIAGDLQVNGITTTVNQTNLDVSDNIIGLNRGSSTNANDSGIIIERGSTGDNAAILWDESEDYFHVGTTASDASSTGNIAVATGNLYATIAKAAQPNITSVGTLTGLSVSGNVGVGVTAPTSKLHVKNTSAGNVLRQLRLHNDSTTAGTGAGIAFTNSTSETFVGASIDSVRTTSTANGNLVFSTRADATANDDNAVVERMRINPTGEVGIGKTATAGVELDVNGDIAASGNITGTLGTAAQTAITSVGTLTGLTVSGAVTIDSQTLTVDSTNNRVGVGTNAPGAPLHIRKSAGGGTLIRQLRLTNDTNAQGTGSGIIFNNADNGGEGHGDFINAAIDSIDTESGLRSGNLVFSTRPNSTGGDAAVIERMRINATGEVGIGKTATTGVELDVNGDIAASGTVNAKGFSLNANTFTVVSTTSTLAASTNGLTVILQNTGPITITLPTLAAGHVTTFISETNNDVTFVADTGITVNSFNGANTTAGIFAQCQVIYKTTAIAFLGGNLV